MGKYTVERSRTIDAPAAQIWSELLDVNRWPEWKPFIPAASWQGGKLEPGSRFKMKICVKGRLAAPVSVKVVALSEPNYVAWTGGIPGAATSVHSFALEDRDGRTRVTSREDFTGALVFLMRWFLSDDDLGSLHDRWLEAIANRVEVKRPF